MKGEWNKPRETPKDHLFYRVTQQVVDLTEQVLWEYGRLECEGLVYWIGKKYNNEVLINGIVAPQATAYPARIESKLGGSFNGG